MTTGSVFTGTSPLQYNAKDPITLLLFQIILILAVCNIVHLGLRHLWQPRVISEVVGGLLLGPSVMGHIPCFTETIFPQPSMPVLNSCSTLGLIFLMFPVGLEVDLSAVRKNAKPAVMVAIFGMLLPFGLGCALAVGMFEHFSAEHEGANFGVFVLFIGLALSITAFPILARILMDCGLLDTPLGIISLAAGVANDVIGWSLLAVAVALASAGSGLVALYIVLACAGLVLLMLFAVRPCLQYAYTKLDMGGDQNDLFTMLVLMIVLCSSFFTAMIGIHPIFGAFLAGLIVPKQDNIAEALTSRLQALVYNILLPPFFATCGLNTDISSLTSALDWAYVIGIVAVAFIAKVLGGFIAARLCSIPIRQSWTVGILMSCKGIVEIIALNVALEAGIIEEKCYTAMIIMAVVLTGVTQPLVLWIYPVGKRSVQAKNDETASREEVMVEVRPKEPDVSSGTSH